MAALAQAVVETHPQQTVELWAMDEHRVGLKPILRHVWARRGNRPCVKVRQRYQWVYVYAFVQPSTGRTFWLLLPTVSLAAFAIALQLFAQAVGAGPHNHILLVLDGAGWHRSPALLCPPGLQLLFLPAYSPELQPAEHLWVLSDAPIINQCFDTLDALEAVLADRCVWLQQHPALIRSTTCFHWWPTFI
jgi:transposase